MLKPSYAAILASTALLSLASGAPPVQAADSGISGGHILVCDTAEEVEAVLASRGANVAASLVMVNNHFGKQSCNVVTVAFYRGDEAKTMLSRDGIVRIVKVNVIGVLTADGWVSIDKPMPQYVGILEKATIV